MKKTIIRRKYINEPGFKRDFDRLKLPQDTVAPLPPAPELGKVQIPAHSYEDNRAVIAARHLSAHKSVLDSFVWLSTTWEKVLQSRFMLLPDDGAALDRIKERKRVWKNPLQEAVEEDIDCLLYTSPSPRD